MFLQFAVLGSWAPVLGHHLAALGLDRLQIGAILSTGSLGLILMSPLMGQIADRWLAAEKLLAVCFLMNAAFLILAWRVGASDPARFGRLWGLMLAASLFLAPTFALTSAVAFHHLRDARRDFAVVRVFGTIGWIAAGLALGAWMALSRRPIGDCLAQGAAFGLLNAVLSLTLPSTPPRRDAAARFAFGRAIGMLRNPTFALFTALSFVLAIFSTFSYFRAAEFYAAIGVRDEVLSTALSVGQLSEILAMLLLPWLYGRFGVKAVIALGLTAWVARYGLLALGKPLFLMLAAQGLHGFCFTFASVAGQLYVERVCPPDVRASAQGLHSLVGGGLGMFLGGYAGGFVLRAVSADAGPAWTRFWAVAAAGCLVVLVVLLAAFRPRDPAPVTSA